LVAKAAKVGTSTASFPTSAIFTVVIDKNGATASEIAKVVADAKALAKKYKAVYGGTMVGPVPIGKPAVIVNY
jgi:hypothetical protein